MSVAAVLIDNIKVLQENLLSAFRLSMAYINKNKPIESIYYNFIATIKNFLTINKKIKIARFRVNHLRYRLSQMEALIADNNPNYHANGKGLNLLR